jgi:hypothetical protein
MIQNERNDTFLTIDTEELRFAVLKDYELMVFDELKEMDVLILEFINKEDTFNQLKLIRTHSDRKIYLKPVFLYKAFDLHDEVILSLSDGQITDLKQLEPIMSTAQRIIKLAEYG